MNRALTPCARAACTLYSTDEYSDLLRRGMTSRVQRHGIAGQQRKAGHELELLKKCAVISGRFQPGRCETFSNIVGGLFEAGTAVAASLQLIRRQISDVLEKAARV